MDGSPLESCALLKGHRSESLPRTMLGMSNSCSGKVGKRVRDLTQDERNLRNTESFLRHYEEAGSLYRVEGNVLKAAHTVGTWETFIAR